MNYAKVTDGVLQEYPYTKEMLIRDNPNTSFGASLSPESLASWGLYVVHPLPHPEFNVLTHKRIETNPVFDGENWVQQWSIEALSAEESTANISAAKERIGIQAQQRLDNFAKTRGYDNIVVACTYATSANSVYRTEGQRCVDLRDAVWAALSTIFAAVDAKQREMVSNIHELDAELPELTWD